MAVLFEHVKPETLESQFPLIAAQMDKLRKLSDFIHGEVTDLAAKGQGNSARAKELRAELFTIDGTISEIASQFGYGTRQKLDPARQ